MNKFHKMLQMITNSSDDDGGDGEIKSLQAPCMCYVGFDNYSRYSVLEKLSLDDGSANTEK